MEILKSLLLLYAGLICINLILATLLWRAQRSDLNRELLFVWGTTVVGFVAQGALSQGDLPIVLGFSFTFLVNLALARILASIAGARVPWKACVAAFAGAIGVAVVAALAGAPFLWVALPVSVAVAGPLLSVTTSVVRDGAWKRLSLSGRALLVSSLVFVAHNLDFPFLRDKPEFAALGFTVAIMIVFALSIFAPAVAIESATEATARVSAEMDVAHRIQTEILPKGPRIEGLELVCYMRPAEKVGGDYYDVINDGKYSWLLLGDVTGHGLSSGLVMLMAQSIMSAIVRARPEVSPGELNFLANQVLHDNLKRLNELRSMTIVSICRVGTENRFVFSGSHDDIYIHRAATGDVEVVKVCQIPYGLGFLDEQGKDQYTESEFLLAPGDLLLVLTDGITEAAEAGDYHKGQFDERRVIELLKAQADAPLEDIQRKLLDQLDAFTSGIFHDDVTFVLARSRPAPA